MQEYKREESKQRQLRRKKQKKEDDVQKRMETTGNAALATTVGELPLKKKNRKLQRHKPSSSAAVDQLKQTNKESSVEAKEEITATVDTTEDGEVEEDKSLQKCKVWVQLR